MARKVILISGTGDYLIAFVVKCTYHIRVHKLRDSRMKSTAILAMNTPEYGEKVDAPVAHCDPSVFDFFNGKDKTNKLLVVII